MNDDLKDAGDHPSVKEDLRRAWQGIRLAPGFQAVFSVLAVFGSATVGTTLTQARTRSGLIPIGASWF